VQRLNSALSERANTSTLMSRIRNQASACHFGPHLCLVCHTSSRNSPQRREASPKGFTNCGRFPERFTNGKRLPIVNLFIWLSKNRFTNVVFVANRFTNDERDHICEPILTSIEQCTQARVHKSVHNVWSLLQKDYEEISSQKGPQL